MRTELIIGKLRCKVIKGGIDSIRGVPSGLAKCLAKEARKQEKLAKSAALWEEA